MTGEANDAARLADARANGGRGLIPGYWTTPHIRAVLAALRDHHGYGYPRELVITAGAPVWQDRGFVNPRIEGGGRIETRLAAPGARIAVAGRSGTGRTRLAQHLACALSREAVTPLVEAIGAWTLPVLIRPEESGAPARPTFDALLESHLAHPAGGGKASRAWVRERIEAGNALVVVDDADASPMIAEAVRDGLARHPGTRFALTAGPHASADFAAERLELLPWTEAMARRAGMDRIGHPAWPGRDAWRLRGDGHGDGPATRIARTDATPLITAAHLQAAARTGEHLRDPTTYRVLETAIGLAFGDVSDAERRWTDLERIAWKELETAAVGGIAPPDGLSPQLARAGGPVVAVHGAKVRTGHPLIARHAAARRIARDAVSVRFARKGRNGILDADHMGEWPTGLADAAREAAAHLRETGRSDFADSLEHPLAGSPAP